MSIESKLTLLSAGAMAALAIAPGASAQGVDVQKALREPTVQAAITACGADREKLCANVTPGGGRIVKCLAAQSDKLSPTCKSAMLEAQATLKKSGVLAGQN